MSLLECIDLTCGYEQPILEGINFTVDEGEIVALLGGSGSGKSTLLRTIVGLLPPMAGKVVMFGESLWELTPEARNELIRRTGMAFQSDALFGSMTIGENIRLPLDELTNLPDAMKKEMVRMKLGLVGLTGFEDRLPNSLSGGQRKRAGLARATILDPKLVFCDEPTAGLDPVVAASIDDMLLQFRSALDISLLVVTHELESIRRTADRALMLADGRILAHGTIEELTASTDHAVYNFFHRIPPAGEQARQS